MPSAPRGEGQRSRRARTRAPRRPPEPAVPRARGAQRPRHEHRGRRDARMLDRDRRAGREHRKGRRALRRLGLPLLGRGRVAPVLLRPGRDRDRGREDRCRHGRARGRRWGRVDVAGAELLGRRAAVRRPGGCGRRRLRPHGRRRRHRRDARPDLAGGVRRVRARVPSAGRLRPAPARADRRQRTGSRRGDPREPDDRRPRRAGARIRRHGRRHRPSEAAQPR